MTSADSRIRLVKGDITRVEADAIVNAANSLLRGGDGVDGAIHRAAGPALAEACRLLVDKEGPCPSGGAVLTIAGALPMRFVIHAVGPTWQGGDHGEARRLTSAYRRTLELANLNQVRRLAFPNISTGIYGYPKAEAADIALRTVREFLDRNTYPEVVLFVCLDDENAALYEAALQPSA